MSARSRGCWRGHRWRESAWTRARAVASLGMVFGIGAVGTMAYWVDNATVTTGTFSVATVELLVNGEEAYEDWELSAPEMMPGSEVSAPLEVQNTGDTDFTYTATAQATGDALLAPHLTLTAYTAYSGETCGGNAIGSTALEVGAAAPLVTNSRSLDGSASETLCFTVELSSAVPKEASNRSVDVIVQFTAPA